MDEKEAEEVKRIEVLNTGGLNKARENLMVVLSLAVEGTVPKSDFAHNDIIAQEPLGDVVVSADFRRVQAGDQLVAFCCRLANKLVGARMIDPSI